MERLSEQNLITPEAADLLISKRDGHMTLLYLYLCRTGCTDREKASRDLFLPPSTLNEAYERLEMIGLLPLRGVQPVSGAHRTLPMNQVTAAVSPVTVPDESLDLPSYTSAEVKQRTEDDSAFSALINEARLVVGRHLSTQDLIKLLGIYDHFDLPADVMMLLMHFVADRYREDYGTGRLPTVGAFEREGRRWRERGITDFDAAERYIQEWRERRGLYAEIKAVMNVVGREFTDTERRYVDSWISMGFRADVIGLAYDKTVTNTRKFSPGYMNKILLNWQEKGLFTLDAIREKDRPGTAAGKGISPVPDPAAVRSLVDQI